MAFRVGDRVKINAAGWEHREAHWESSREFPRDGVYEVDAVDEGELDGRGQIRVFCGPDLVGWFDDEHLEHETPEVVSRFADLAEDPAMLPVLEAAADLLSGLPHIRRAKSAELALTAAMKQYQREGAECSE